MEALPPGAQDVPAMEEKVRALMPGVIDELRALVAIPSVAFPGYPRAPVLKMADATAALLRRYGLRDARLLGIPGGYPAVIGGIPPPADAPTVLFYAHYDVQPARAEDGWKTAPYDPVIRNGRLYGRGAADNKAGIASIAGTLKAVGPDPPCGIRVVIEGEEETESHLGEVVRALPELFRCDLFVITDMGNLETGEPVISTTLRGEVSCIVTIRTLPYAIHSGSFGGAAPDALVALIRTLATLHDDQGNVAVRGLTSPLWEGVEYPEALYRRLSGVPDGIGLIGSGSIASRVWSKPSVTVIGIDAPPVEDASNILIPQARARISMRIAPGADPDRELGLLTDHLRAHVPWNATLEISRAHGSPGFTCPDRDPGLRLAERVMEAVYHRAVHRVGGGGSIPLMNALKEAVPGAGFVLWGCEDNEHSRIHGVDESVDLGELERMIVIQALLLNALGGVRSPRR